jgi:hypothetical protein
MLSWTLKLTSIERCGWASACKYFSHRHAIISKMADPDAPRPQPRPITPLKSALNTTPAGEPKVLCDRCGGEVYRMHAVWRCAACGFKSDCCGW